jgi:LPPG:FO 2-phospho-L-lactate transferase
VRVVALAGGTGSAKLLRGLAGSVPNFTVVANVGDNYWAHCVYVCPDIDIAMYTLAGVSDERKGWGIEGDSFIVTDQLARLGEEAWFRLGDLDFATSFFRTKLLLAGRTLTGVTEMLRTAFRVKQRILPATDSDLETWMVTEAGRMHLQEYWVRDQGRHRVERLEYSGARRARPTAAVNEAISRADRVLICPANPVTSIGPILAIGGMKRLLSRCKARVTALSPMVGKGPYNGPAGRLMRDLGVRPDSVGVAALYAGFVDELVIDRRDAGLRRQIEGRGVSCSTAETLMRTRSDERRLASMLLRA